MRHIDIVGVGCGPASLTPEAAAAIARAEIVIGSPRLVDEYATAGQLAVAASRPDDVVAALRQAGAGPAVVLMSGDSGFHSGAAKVFAALAGDDQFEVKLVAGLSAPQVLAARLGIAWDDACLVSCHGTGADLVAPVRRHRHTFALTGGNVAALGQALAEAGYGELAVWAGENLGLDGEKITTTTVGGLPGKPWASLTVLLLENPCPEARLRSGIPDDEFTRGEVPMTKQAIRAQVLSRLGIRPGDVCWDIGCGTGSVTVEMALAAYAGQVWAVDHNLAALELTRQNCREFHVGNVTVTAGVAPEAIAGWPAPDVVFVGGSGGKLADIAGLAFERNPAARIAVTAIAVESAAAAVQVLAAHGIEPEISQISASSGRVAGGLHLLIAQNPVTIVSGAGHAEQ